ncbi:MAG: arsenical resistance operon transcriptional repressor ArsD [Candidatus Schekmanbacteria bacterium]|nr:MAG: arsenical resistance operon transcriptional repressor ArsD [Candidatus Schekmanbacteria bacterium]
MKTLKIYDPALCCSTGVCGPNPDEKLVKLAAFLKGLNEKECKVERYNLAQQPEAYKENKVVANLMKKEGVKALPIFFINDEVVFSGEYPDISELEKLLNIASVDESDASCCDSEDCGCS